MGKGDARSKKGKIFKGTYGKSRPHKVKVTKHVAVKKGKTTTKK